MRKKKVLLISALLLILMGVAAVIIGVFAYQLGLDNNPIMGGKRKALVAAGILLLAIPPLWPACSRLARRLGWTQKLANSKRRFAKTSLAKWLGAPRPAQRQTWIWALSASVIVIVAAAWYLTAGTFVRWTPYSRYYDRQADAFLAGQLALLEQPPAALAQVPDIFNWRAREGIDYLWDASYYQGKYYLYWGPAPALVAAGIKLIHPGVVEDQILVMIFISGLGMVLSALFHWLRKTYFPSAPGWTILLFTLTTVLCVPVFWLVNRPSVYEAAIAAAQCFFLLGVYAALRGVYANGKRPGWLILAGLALGCAVASRFSYVFAVVFIALVILFVLLRRFFRKEHKLSPLLAFSLPLLLVAAGFAWFNYARFGSITETGMKYQLTGDALPVDRSLVFSTGYISPNVYSSLFRPLQVTPGQFPFFSTPYILDNMWPNIVHRQKTYYSGEPVAGIFATVPFLWLLVLLLIMGGRLFLDWVNERPRAALVGSREEFPLWGSVMIAGGLLIQLATNMTFVMTTMRYLADFTPMFVLTVALLVWGACSRLVLKPGWRLLLLLTTLLLSLASITIGLLTNLQGADWRFANNNPMLYNTLVHFFSKAP